MCRSLRTVKHLPTIAEDATHMAELFVSGVAPFAPRKLTDMTAQVKDWKLGTVEVISWKSKDGALIEGILHKPADYDPCTEISTARRDSRRAYRNSLADAFSRRIRLSRADFPVKGRSGS